MIVRWIQCSRAKQYALRSCSSVRGTGEVLVEQVWRPADPAGSHQSGMWLLAHTTLGAAVERPRRDAGGV